MSVAGTSSKADAKARTVMGLLPTAARDFPERLALRHPVAGEWHDVTFAEMHTIAGEVARGLIAVGVRPGDRVALICSTRPEWTIADFAITMAGGVVVPVSPTSSPDEIAWLLGDCGATVAICEGEEQALTLSSAAERLDALAQIVVIDEAGPGRRTLADLRELGRSRPVSELQDLARAVGPEDIYTIMYTSGSTGMPKGCVLTHANLAASVDILQGRELLHGADDLVYLYLPLAHVFGLLVQLAACRMGTPIAFWGGDPQRILGELQEIRPTYLPTVPRILEKAYGLAVSGTDATTVQRAVEVAEAVRGLEESDVPPELAAEFDEYDKTVFARAREALGGRVRETSIGAAPIAEEIPRFFNAAGVPIMEAYGLTEATGLCATNTPKRWRLGTVGQPFAGVELRVADDGELLVRGPVIFKGYYKAAELTFGAITDGWLHTGDLGTIDHDGFVSITGRKKDLIVTAGGENVSPANLENELKLIPWISQAVVYGDRRPYLVVLLTLNRDELPALAADIETSEISLSQLSEGELAEHPAVIERVTAEIERLNGSRSRAAQIRRFCILDRDLSHGCGELTSTMKVKRNVVYEKHAAQFEALYGGDGPPLHERNQ